MKVFGIGLAAGALMFAACSNEVNQNEVPSVVFNSFKTTYPEATAVEWENKQNYFEVDFELEEVEQEVGIDSSGKILFVKEEITLTELPEAVKNTVSTDFPDKEIDEVDRIQKGDRIYFEVEFSGLLNDKAHFFNEEGKAENGFSFVDQG